MKKLLLTITLSAVLAPAISLAQSGSKINEVGAVPAQPMPMQSKFDEVQADYAAQMENLRAEQNAKLAEMRAEQEAKMAEMRAEEEARLREEQERLAAIRGERNEKLLTFNLS